MSQKSSLRAPFDRQHRKRVKTLIKSQQQHLYNNHWSLWRKLNWKMSLLVTCKISRLFVNILTAEGKYSLLSRDNLIQATQMHLPQTEKLFLHLFVQFSNVKQISNIFKKSWLSQLMYFPNYGLWDAWLDKCVKSPVTEDLLTGNVVNSPKHCFNLHNSTFTIFIDQFEGNWVGKSHS